MNRMILTSPCAICNNKGDCMMKNHLQSLEQICDNFTPKEPVDDSRHNLMWGIHSHCRYGLTCHDLSQFDRECQQIADSIESKLIAIAKEHDNSYYEILRLLQGYFPSVYRSLEEIYNRNRKE